MEEQEPIIEILLSHVKEKKSLPPMSNNSLLLQKQLTKESPDIDKIQNLIKADPSLTVHVLKLANSAMYRGLEKADTIKEAVLRLGFDEVRNLAMWAIHHSGFQTRDPFIKSHKKRLWFHSLSCASGAAWAAKYLRLEEIKDKVFIAGLLHDIGTLYLLTALESLKSDDKINQYPSDHVLQELLHAKHTEQGYELLLHWNLPESYLIAARDHHTENFDTKNLLLTLIRLIDKICLKMEGGNKPQDMAELVSSPEAAILGLSEIRLAEIEIGIEQMQEKFKSLF